MNTSEVYRREIEKMCAEMSESQLQRVLARVQHIWLTNCTPPESRKEGRGMTEQDQFLHSIAKLLARAENPKIAVQKFVEALKTEKNELKVFEKEQIA